MTFQDNDYRETVFSQGVVCMNKNNHTYCVVIDGKRGSEDDRCSLVLEVISDEGFVMHTPPNRALIPTGRICDLKFLAKILKQCVVIDD